MIKLRVFLFILLLISTGLSAQAQTAKVDEEEDKQDAQFDHLPSSHDLSLIFFEKIIG